MLFLLWLAKGFQYINSANYIDSPEEKEENKSEEISLEEKSSMWKKRQDFTTAAIVHTHSNLSFIKQRQVDSQLALVPIVRSF